MKRFQPAASLTPPQAISYVRFSSPEQARGDSLRRQTTDTEGWCERNGVPLSTSLSIRDLGLSAYHGKHRDEKAALGGFLEAARAGRVPRGWFLVIENLDRLSREEERTALRLWMDILDAGVNIVQLHPETVFRHERSDMTDIIRAIIELSRGHSESRMKSVRATSLWEERRRKAAEVGQLMTRRLPAWIEVGEDGLQRLIPERVEVVRRIFEMCAAGNGRLVIAKKLTEAGVPAFGACEEGEDGRRRKVGAHFGSGKWLRGYVDDILTDKRVLGELQPRDRDGQASGKPIPDYYLPAVTKELFYAAQAASDCRRKGTPGRLGNGVANLFAGLLYDARDGGAYWSTFDGWDSVLINRSGAEGGTTRWTFPVVAFERAVLSRLTAEEMNLAEVLTPAAAPSGADDLRNELEYVRGEIEAFRAALNAANSVTVAQELAKREARVAELTALLERLNEEEAYPLSAAVGEVRRLTPTAVYGGRLAELDAAQAAGREDARMRLRAALRRVVDSAYLLITHRSESRGHRIDRRGRVKLLTAQINLRGGAVRWVRVTYRPSKKAGSKYPKPAEWRADSLKFYDPAGKLDLRKPEDAAGVLWSMEQEGWGPTEFAFGEVMEDR